MSLYCPKCWAKARCTDSRCDERANTVRRRHQCTEPSCLHRFTSVELILGEVDLRAENSSSLIKLAWEIFDKLGGYAAENDFIQAWRDYKASRNQRKPREAKVQKIIKPAPDHPWRRSKMALRGSAPEGERRP